MNEAAAILFDMDDTLYPRIDPFRKSYEKTFREEGPLGGLRTAQGDPLWPVPEERMSQLYGYFLQYGYEVYEDWMQGRLSMDEMFIYRIRETVREQGLILTDEQTMIFQRQYAWEQEHLELTGVMEELLSYLCRKPYFLGIISNGGTDHQRIKYDALGLGRFIGPEHFLPTGEIGVSKPDPKALLFAQERWHLDPERTWYIGDNFGHDIASSASIGWHTIWLNRYPQQKKPGSAPEGVPDYTVHNEEEMLELIRRLF